MSDPIIVYVTEVHEIPVWVDDEHHAMYPSEIFVGCVSDEDKAMAMAKFDAEDEGQDPLMIMASDSRFLAVSMQRPAGIEVDPTDD